MKRSTDFLERTDNLPLAVRVIVFTVFAYVGFAALWGVIFFADILDGISILGMVLIVGAGILSLRH